jgi:hypothetical protein
VNKLENQASVEENDTDEVYDDDDEYGNYLLIVNFYKDLVKHIKLHPNLSNYIKLNNENGYIK